MEKAVLHIEGMRCAHCAAAVESYRKKEVLFGNRRLMEERGVDLTLKNRPDGLEEDKRVMVLTVDGKVLGK